MGTVWRHTNVGFCQNITCLYAFCMELYAGLIMINTLIKLITYNNVFITSINVHFSLQIFSIKCQKAISLRTDWGIYPLVICYLISYPNCFYCVKVYKYLITFLYIYLFFLFFFYYCNWIDQNWPTLVSLFSVFHFDLIMTAYTYKQQNNAFLCCVSEWVCKWVSMWVSECVSEWVCEWVCKVSECVSEWVCEWV